MAEDLKSAFIKLDPKIETVKTIASGILSAPFRTIQGAIFGAFGAVASIVSVPVLAVVGPVKGVLNGEPGFMNSLKKHEKTNNLKNNSWDISWVQNSEGHCPYEASITSHSIARLRLR